MIRTAGLSLAAALAGVVLLHAEPAVAQIDLLSRETLSGLVDLRLAAADGEKSWTDHAYGKTRYSGAGDDFRLTPQVAEAALLWKPRLSWDLGAVVHLAYQSEQTHPVDVVEAYLAYKPAPRSDWRYSARAGLFYPPVSMEHDDVAWGVSRSITPSAINSWIGEEVKVVAFENKIARGFGGQELALTGAVFGDNDTSGTLLALRGWAFDDVLTTMLGKQPLPTLKPPYTAIWRDQADWTLPTRELDGRLGYYGRLDWRSGGPLVMNLVYYDNGGDRRAVSNGQWSWATSFWNLGASYDLGPHTQIISQAMTGNTQEGFDSGKGYWLDVDFSSAFLLATHGFGKNALTARVDWFDTVDHTYVQRDDNNEHGWGYTAAWRHDFTPRIALFVEALHVVSGRLAREYIGVGPRQEQTVLQSALRLKL